MGATQECVIQFDGHFKDSPSGTVIAETPGQSLFAGTIVASGQEHDVVVDALPHIPFGYAALVLEIVMVVVRS